jgi:hypothetical protein
MNYTIERTDEHIVVRFPKAMNDQTLLDALDHLEFISLAKKSKASQEEIDQLVREVKKGTWERTKERLRGQPGFEGIDDL